VFLWFVGIGALTLAMSGGIARRPKRVKPVPEPEPEPVDEEPIDEEPEMADEEPVDGEPEMAEPEMAPAQREYPDTQEDPEDHFVADDDATRDGKSEAAD